MTPTERMRIARQFVRSVAYHTGVQPPSFLEVRRKLNYEGYLPQRVTDDDIIQAMHEEYPGHHALRMNPGPGVHEDAYHRQIKRSRNANTNARRLMHLGAARAHRGEPMFNGYHGYRRNPALDVINEKTVTDAVLDNMPPAARDALLARIGRPTIEKMVEQALIAKLVEKVKAIQAGLA